MFKKNVIVEAYNDRYEANPPLHIFYVFCEIYRFQSPRSLRRASAAADLLGLRVRVLPKAWIFVSSECFVVLGRGLCVVLMTYPEKSCRMWYVH